MLKKLIRRVLSAGIVNRTLKGKVYIFCLHDISPADAIHHYNGYSTTPERWEEQLQFICRYFEIIPVSELARPEQLSRKKAYACITFDDGFRSVLQVAAPMLKQKNIPFSVFVNEQALLRNSLWCSDLVMMNSEEREQFYDRFADSTKMSREQFRANPVLSSITGLRYSTLSETGKQDRPVIYMTPDELRILQVQYGAEVGYHSNTHKNLAMCGGAELEKEILPSGKEVRELIAAQPVRMFAIPFGKKNHYTADTIRLLQQQHYQIILSTSADYNKVGKISLPVVSRIGITNENKSELCFIINKGLIKKYNI